MMDNSNIWMKVSWALALLLAGSIGMNIAGFFPQNSYSEDRASIQANMEYSRSGIEALTVEMKTIEINQAAEDVKLSYMSQQLNSVLKNVKRQ
jgi:FlaG/FlaF family flagellin (archaellin)